MAIVLIAGCTGGMGSILLERMDTGKFQGRDIALLICLDYFPGDAKAGAAALSSKLKTKSLVLHWDAAAIESTTAVAAAVDAATDHLDGVLITTGLGFHGNLEDMGLEESHRVLNRLMQVNAIGPSLLSQYCATKLKHSKYIKEGAAPTLLLMSSFSGVVGLPHRAAYCSSKFALNGYLETVHAEFPSLRVVLVCPTSVSTGFRDNWKKDMAKQGVKVEGVDVNAADLTAEQCVDAVWSAFDAKGAKAGLQYDILPTGKTAAAFWLVRLPWIGNWFVRPSILNRSSKL